MQKKKQKEKKGNDQYTRWNIALKTNATRHDPEIFYHCLLHPLKNIYFRYSAATDILLQPCLPHSLTTSPLNTHVLPSLTCTLYCTPYRKIYIKEICSLSNVLCGFQIKGFLSEWCISTIYHAWDTPFWPGTLKMKFSKRKRKWTKQRTCSLYHEQKVMAVTWDQIHSTRVFIVKSLVWLRDWNSLAGSVLGSLSCMMQHCRFDPPRSHLVKGIFPLELIWALTPLPTTLSDESRNRSKVCTHMHSIEQTQKILTCISSTDECWHQKHIQHAPSTRTECDFLCGWIKKKHEHTQIPHPKQWTQRSSRDCRRRRTGMT